VSSNFRRGSVERTNVPRRGGRGMAKQSAGLLMFRVRSGQLEVFLAHMGGPFWARKDQGAWSIPKGEFGG